MVLSVHRFSKFYSKIDHPLHHPREALPASLHAFRSDVSTLVAQLLLNLKSEFEIDWLHQCFQLLPAASKAFAKLIADIDYPLTSWQPESMEDYLSYSLEALDSFNLITGSISHLSHARLSMLHALTSPSSAVEKIKAIAFHAPAKAVGQTEIKQGEKERRCSDKEAAVAEALIELRSVGLWVCRVVLAVLSGDEKVYTKSERGISNPALVNLDSRVAAMMAKGCSLKEVKELKDLSASISAGGNNGGMVKRLEEFETKMSGIGKEVDHVFSEVLAARNELLNGIRFRK